LYKQIASDLQQKIQSGELAPGEQIPREEALREEYGASRNTIRDAIRWPTSRGLVENKPGKGTYVLRGHRPFVTTPVPFRVTFTILPADRNQSVVNRGKVPEELAAPARDQ
jgi:DNA-binding GntR family transcriptional regulator